MKLAALVRTPFHPVYRYRLRLFEPMLWECGWDVSVKSISQNWLGRFPQFRALRDADSVLLQRRLLSRAEVLTLRSFSRRLVYDFDDAVMYRSSNSPKGPDSRRRESRFRTILEAADVVVAGNRFLADVAERYIHPLKIYRIPTCVDPHQYVPASHENESSSLRLVWIGSASTVRTLNRFSPRLKAVASAVPKAQLKVISDVFPDAMPMPVVRCLWSAEREASDLASADVGISWMPDGPWSQGKCGLKLLQYMAAGLPVVANPVGVHREMVMHGKNGFLAETPEEWVEAIQSLAREPGLRKSMGSAGRKAVLEGYSPRRWADVFVKVVSGAAGI